MSLNMWGKVVCMDLAENAGADGFVEEAVGRVAVRPQREVVAHLQLDALLGEHVTRGHEREVRVIGEELLHDCLVFRLENRARRVDESPALLHETRRARENR